MIDYRKITGTRDLRRWILSTLSWWPDKLIVSLQYYLQTGKKLHLKKPVRFNEKLQAYKLYYHDPLMLECTDKVITREFVKNKGLEKVLVPYLKVYDKAEDIDYENLPDKFVIKTSDGGGSNEVIVCHHKDEEMINNLKKKTAEWMKFPRPKKHIAREWAYQNNYPRRIIVEPLLEESGKQDIDDFKFYCFNGKFRFLQWHKDRTGDHRAAHYDENGKFLPDVYIFYPTFDKAQPLPDNFDEMVKVAEKLSEDFPFVRVDLYNVNGKIYFSELTFYPASGYYTYCPEYVDEWLGSFFEYPFKKK